MDTNQATDLQQPSSSSAATPVPAPAQAADTPEVAAVCHNTASSSLPVPPSSPSGAPNEILLKPWLDHKGHLNRPYWKALVQLVMGVVLRNPGIPEHLLQGQINVINPQSAVELLGILVQQQYLILKQHVSPAAPTPPSLLLRRRQQQNRAVPGVLEAAAGTSAAAGNNRADLTGGLLGGMRTVQHSKQVVNHYYPSLKSCSIAHEEALPLVCVRD
eukprot:jgi/Chrzof1/7670/Cz02g32110.t1